ncbi:MAG: DUF192 domain-containing protein [Pseudomonadota bacterium]
MVKVFGIGLAFVLAACSPAESGAALSQSQSNEASVSETETRTHPVSGLEIIEVTVMRGEQEIIFKTELADTSEAQARGLMFRTELADDEAMIFPTQMPQQRSFWMKNTPLSLDLIFVGEDNRITNIAANAVPYSLESIPSAGLAIAVVEVRGGLASELGIVPGDKVTW